MADKLEYPEQCVSTFSPSLELPSFQLTGNTELRYIGLLCDGSVSTSSLSDNIIPLFLGSDVLTGTLQSAKNHGRIHARYAKVGLATKLNLEDFRVEGITNSTSLWFYTVQGLFQVVFMYHERSMQKWCLLNLKDIWLQRYSDPLIPESIQVKLNKTEMDNCMKIYKSMHTEPLGEPKNDDKLESQYQTDQQQEKLSCHVIKNTFSATGDSGSLSGVRRTRPELTIDADRTDVCGAANRPGVSGTANDNVHRIVDRTSVSGNVDRTDIGDKIYASKVMGRTNVSGTEDKMNVIKISESTAEHIRHNKEINGKSVQGNPCTTSNPCKTSLCISSYVDTPQTDETYRQLTTELHTGDQLHKQQAYQKPKIRSDDLYQDKNRKLSQVLKQGEIRMSDDNTVMGEKELKIMKSLATVTKEYNSSTENLNSAFVCRHCNTIYSGTRMNNYSELLPEGVHISPKRKLKSRFWQQKRRKLKSGRHCKSASSNYTLNLDKSVPSRNLAGLKSNRFSSIQKQKSVEKKVCATEMASHDSQHGEICKDGVFDSFELNRDSKGPNDSVDMLDNRAYVSLTDRGPKRTISIAENKIHSTKLLQKSCTSEQTFDHFESAEKGKHIARSMDESHVMETDIYACNTILKTPHFRKSWDAQIQYIYSYMSKCHPEDNSDKLNKFLLVLTFLRTEFEEPEGSGFDFELFKLYLDGLQKMSGSDNQSQFDIAPRRYIFLTVICKWLGNIFHKLESKISQRVENFKLKHINCIDNLPPANEIIDEVFPGFMKELVCHWTGQYVAMATGENDVLQDHTYENKNKVQELKEARPISFPLIQFILEFTNNALISGVAHVVFSKIKNSF